MTEKERQQNGMLYNPYKVEGNSWKNIRSLIKAFNESEFWKDRTALNNLRKVFKQSYDDMVLTVPFFCDHGINISFGKHFYANTGLTILDEGQVVFGDNVFLGPHVSIYTAGHPIDAQVRNLELEYAKPVTIGSDVWIGGNVVINPGVTIGDDVVIGSGSVITKDIPPHCVAAGNPCRVIRQITEADRTNWMEQVESYRNDPDIDSSKE